MTIPSSAPEEAKSARADDKAEGEEKTFSLDIDQDDRKIASQSKWGRHYAKMFFLAFFVVASITVIVVWLIHLIASPSWRFLPDEDISALKNLLFGATVGSGLSAQFVWKKLLN